MSDQTTQQAPHATGMQYCVTECLSCHQLCLETIAFCLRTGGEHAQEDHIRLLTDCALRRRLHQLRGLRRVGEHVVAAHPIHLRQNGRRASVAAVIGWAPAPPAAA